MYKTLTILLLTALMAQAQTTLLCEDDFSSSAVIGCNISAPARQNLQRINGVLRYQFVNTNTPLVQPFIVSFTSDLSEYDTLKLEMNLTTKDSSYFTNSQIMINNPHAPIQFAYRDVVRGSVYFGNMNESPRPPVKILLFGSSNTYYLNKLTIKIAKPVGMSSNFMSIEIPTLHSYMSASWGILNPTIIGNYGFEILQDQEFHNSIRKAFCSSINNPYDCIYTVYYSQPIPSLQFDIDNFKAYGIKKVVTGLEDEITPSSTRTLVGMYNPLGQKMGVDQIHEGLVIKMYSDGTKEKVVVSNK
jgi:hypothetical protein